MEWHQIESQWHDLRGALRAKWGKLTDDDFEQIAGDKDRFLGKLQRRYGYKKNQAESELNQWLSAFERNQGKSTH